MSDDAALVGYGDRDIGIWFEHDALASQAAFYARIDGAVNEIFLFVRNFFEVLLAFFHINMAGGAGANTSAVMVEVDVVFLCKFQNGLIYEVASYCFRSYGGIFKLKTYGGQLEWLSG